MWALEAPSSNWASAGLIALSSFEGFPL